MTPLDNIIARLDSFRRKFDQHEGQRAALEQLLHSYESQVAELRELDLSYQRLQKFFQAMGTEEQERLQRWFEQVVTYGLHSVFSNYSFVVVGPEVKANEIAIGFKIIERVGDRDLERDPYEEMGGGVADVLSFLLQFLMVFLLRDRINPVLFLDEAMKHLSVEFRPRMADLLAELANRTMVQIVLISHDPIFAEPADVVYSFTKPGMETLVERIK